LSWPFIPRPCGNGRSSRRESGSSSRKKLAERLIEPRIPASKLRGSSDRYKIKLRAAGFRLVYEVRDHEVLVLVVAVGKRERNAVYRQADQR
jgi:mRNA interferase RelE/StbE